MQNEEIDFYYKETPFKELMANRVADILLVCSNYDQFMLEEDGRIDELLFEEYVALNLRYPPKFTQVSTAKNAFARLSSRKYDLVITMLNIGDIKAIDLARKIKQDYPNIPIIVLTPISTREIVLKLKDKDTTSIDYIFAWQGNPNILLAMVKLIEDKMNVTYDVNTVGVQTIILVEDSIRYYSSYLPMIYRTLFKQARCLMTEGLNEFQQTMRMRGRPKILLARDYEEAVDLYETYKNNLLGVISDVTYKRRGREDTLAGIQLCEHIRKENKELPILLQSSNIDHQKKAQEYDAEFIYKHSKTLLNELLNHIKTNYGFGDFIFKDPDTLTTIGQAHDLWDLQHKIMETPDNSFAYHVTNNDFSKWFKARAIFSLANYLKPKQISDFGSISATRDFFINTIKTFRIQESRGTIAEFRRERYDELTFFSRIGSGSLGGKGRGLAFIDLQLKQNRIRNKFSNVIVTIPKTTVLTTDIFEEFMEKNNLYKTAMDENSDEIILARFLRSRLPDRVLEDLLAFLTVIQAPLAVRSSSLLEDSNYQPFAGIYSTYMLPNNHADFNVRFDDLTSAIKSVYASTFYKNSKDYMHATNNMVEEEKMAVIIQEIAGSIYGDRCYPNISGVARSINFYPVDSEKPEDGIVNIAFGMGKTVVEGGTTLRFSPKHPKKIIQLSDTNAALKSTQNKFFALNMDPDSFAPEEKGDTNLNFINIEDAEKDNSLKLVASTLDFENQILRDGTGYHGKRVITFSSILKYNMFPLAEIINTLLDLGRNAMNVPIEIEFAVNLDTPRDKPKVFSFLQIRPIVEGVENEDIQIEETDPKQTVIISHKAMGNGNYKDLHDLIYVRPETFNPAETKKIAEIIGKLNSSFSDPEGNDRGYILVVPGRLGSTDPWLGIPINWSQISHARVMVELGLSNFRVEPSQGTHFFQNLTALRSAYLTINPYLGDGSLNLEMLNTMEACYEDSYIRHVRFQGPLTVKIDGRNSTGIIRLDGVSSEKSSETEKYDSAAETV